MAEEPREAEPIYRAEASDLLFGYLLAIAVSIGLTPLLPDQAALRYTLSYAILMGFGALAWMLGNPPKVDEAPQQLIRGFLVGIIIGLPFFYVGGAGLRGAVARLFPGLPSGAVLAYALFIITPAETLFFRARAQRHLPWFLVAALSTAWCFLLYLPLLDPLRLPYPATVVAVAITTMNVLFSYLCKRSGLLAAFVTQTVAYTFLLFFPTLTA